MDRPVFPHRDEVDRRCQLDVQGKLLFNSGIARSSRSSSGTILISTSMVDAASHSARLRFLSMDAAVSHGGGRMNCRIRGVGWRTHVGRALAHGWRKGRCEWAESAVLKVLIKTVLGSASPIRTPRLAVARIDTASDPGFDARRGREPETKSPPSSAGYTDYKDT
jgi:hypothetical protein